MTSIPNNPQYDNAETKEVGGEYIMNVFSHCNYNGVVVVKHEQMIQSIKKFNEARIVSS